MDKSYFEKSLKEAIEKAGNNPDKKVRAIFDEYQKIGKIYDSCDLEVQAMFDSHIKIIVELIKENTSKMEDCILKRQSLRLIKKLEGKLYSGNQLISKLELPENEDNEIKHEVAIIFEEGIGTILDLMSDVQDNSENSESTFAILLLFSSIIDELIIANHLLKHNYMNQAFSHIRTIYENFDKIELFKTKPEFVNVWINNPNSDNYRILSPSGIRGLIGKPKFDKHYNTLCELGTHTSFDNLRSRFDVKTNELGELEQVTFWLGGAPFPHNVIFGNGLLISCLQEVHVKLISNFRSSFLKEEASELTKSLLLKVKHFFTITLTKSSKDIGMDISPVLKLFDNFPI